MIVCVIPARGGSKGIPRKNLVRVCGKPLIFWTLEQAAESRLIDEIVVSTDSDEIAFTCGHYGVHVYHRSPETATDDASSESALQEVLRNRYPDAKLCVFLQATSPMRRPGDIDGAIELLRSGSYNSVFSSRHIEGFLWRSPRGLSHGGMVPAHSQRKPRQHMQIENVEENGSIYVFEPQVLDHYNSRLGGVIGAYPMHPLDGYQIDEPEDIPLIESLMRLRGYVDEHATASA